MINRIKQARCSYKLKKTVVSSVVTLVVTMSGLSYADEYVDKAKDYITENKLDSAVIELKNAIQSSPNNAQPRIMLGEIYLDIGNFASAEKELSRALEYNADQNVVLPLLARTLSAQSKSEQVIELVQSSNLSDPYAKTELLALKAASEIKLGQIEDAKYSLELAQEYSYDSLYLQLGKAKLYAISNEVDAALETVNNVLKTTADNSDVWLLKGHLETANQNFAEATKSYRKAYEISPEAIYYSIFIASSLVYEKNFEDAEKYVDKLLTLAPNHILVNKLKATILYDKKDFVGAKEHADRALQGGSNDLTTQIIAAFSAYELKLYEQAYTLLKRIAPRVSDNHPAKRLLISTQFTLGYLDEAVETMNDYPTESESDSSFVSAVSMKLSMLGRDEEALEFALKASESGGDTSDLLLGLIQLSSKDSTGIENLQSAIKNQSDMRKAQLGAALYYIRYGYYMEAETVADQLLTKNPKDVDAITLRGQILQAKGEYISAIELYNDALVIEPQNLNTIVALAQTHANLKQWEEAYSLAFQALELSPHNKDASQVILLAANEVKKLPELLRLVDSQLEQSPDNIDLIHTKSKILMLSDRPSYALNLLESLPDAEKNSETWKFIGNFYYFEKNGRTPKEHGLGGWS
ncbi:XrtA/PEP-CTERM system TPR-repeat protein PrsT [Vibrio algarum]|uniref:PEP-CTERM system TPR-repeat protein PrsT n=1 Tax=Vibrio algarum TaxID=3020714 RepID=A0ABT4YQ62_9VIBR|nr:XrtA/PEP-CTERM system TPR-repeat protein PrsT [Vibrio sp. KJ40-1]MDB1123701.1 PEP-CTERM system TPR-repeat protein PrsT [Vibrio sp. KJ40-1]